MASRALSSKTRFLLRPHLKVRANSTTAAAATTTQAPQPSPAPVPIRRVKQSQNQFTVSANIKSVAVKDAVRKFVAAAEQLEAEAVVVSKQTGLLTYPRKKIEEFLQMKKTITPVGYFRGDPPEDSEAYKMVQDYIGDMVPTYSRPLPVFVHGHGCFIYDLYENEYIDLMAGIAVNGLGYRDFGWESILKNQAELLTHSSNLYHNLWTGHLSRLMIKRTNSEGWTSASRVFLSNSGTEANEAAIKFCRKIGKQRGGDGKHEIVSFHGSFHGRTMGALSATPNEKYQKPFGPIVPGFRYGTLNDIEALDTLVTPETAGVIVEPIQGEGGVNPASAEFLIALRKRCNEVGALLVYDEIQCGMGRTGNLWAHTFAGPEAHPDILTVAKALGNGYPIGATMVTEEVAQGIVIGDHGTTFGGSPMASRLGSYVLSRISNPEFLNLVRVRGEFLRQQLEAIKEEFPDVVTEIRGRGLIQGLALNRDPTDIIAKARERGVLVISAGSNTLRFVPPLIINHKMLQGALNLVRDAMREVIRGGPSAPVFQKGDKILIPAGQKGGLSLSPTKNTKKSSIVHRSIPIQSAAQEGRGEQEQDAKMEAEVAERVTEEKA